jgi:hypothetical protein
MAELKEGPHQVIERSTTLLVAVTLLTLAIIQLLFTVISQVFANVPSLSVIVWSMLPLDTVFHCRLEFCGHRFG